MFEDLTDGELIDLHKKGDIDAFPALFDRYRQMIRGLSSSYFLVGGDRDDLMQEGMLGLLKAVNTYNPGSGHGVFHLRASLYRIGNENGGETFSFGGKLSAQRVVRSKRRRG